MLKKAIVVCVVLSAAWSMVGSMVYLEAITITIDLYEPSEMDKATGVHRTEPMTTRQEISHRLAMLFWPSMWWREFLGFFLVSLATSVSVVLLLHRPTAGGDSTQAD